MCPVFDPDTKFDQPILNYEDIKGVQDARGCHKTKIVKHQLEDQEDAGTTPDEDTSNEGAVAGAAEPAVAAAAPAEGETAAAAPAGGEAPVVAAPAPSPAGKGWTG